MRSILRLLPLLLIAAVLLASFAGGLTYVLRQLNLYPPKEVSIAAGKPGSAYFAIASAYKDILAGDGITLNIMETNGSLENAAALTAEAGADLALIQGGIELGEPALGIASVRLEPLWIFAANPVDDDPSHWGSLTVSIGAEGSGTQVIASKLAAFTGASALDASRARQLSSEAAAAALLDGELDVAMYVASSEAQYLRQLIDADRLHLLELAHSESIALRIPGARLVRLPSGVLDYRRPLPSEDMDIIALVTRLVSREELHPALINRLVHAVMKVHGGYRVIPAERLYPSTEDLGVEADPYAAQLFDEGFSALESILPYWIVAQLNSVLLILLPALLLLLPLMRLIPTLYEAFLKRRVFGHYARVHEIDALLVKPEAATLDADELEGYGRELDSIEQKLLSINLPNAFRKQAYTVLHHLDSVRRRLDKVMASGSTSHTSPQAERTE